MKKALSCILSFLPLLLIAFSLILLLVFGIIFGEGTLTAIQTIIMILLLAMELIGVLLALTLIVIYIVKACKNPDISTGMKVAWCFIIYSFNIFVFPVYWFIYIRKE